MDNNKKYNVTILRTNASESVILKLSNLLKVTEKKIQLILEKDSFVIKKGTSQALAKKLCDSIVSAGANCRIDEVLDSDDGELPVIEEVVSNQKAKPLTDITQPKISPLQQDDVSLSLEEVSKQESVSSENDNAFKTIQPELFCPTCGTVRAKAESKCVHCGYNPEEINKKKLMRKRYIAAALIIIAIIAAFVSFPYLQESRKQSQIQEDMALAFDTRNKISGFIKQTNFWPNQNIDANLKKNISNNSIKSIIVSENALMTVTIRADALYGEEKTIIFIPSVLKGRIVWNCRKGTLDEQYRPNICRNTPIIE